MAMDQAPAVQPTKTAEPPAVAPTVGPDASQIAPSMDTLQPANVENIVTGSTIIFFDEEDGVDSDSGPTAAATPALDSSTVAALSDSRTTVVNAGAATVIFPDPEPTTAEPADSQQESTTVSTDDDEYGTGDEENGGISQTPTSDAGPAASTSVVTVTASPVTTTVAVPVTKKPVVGPGGSEIQVSDLLSLGSLGINGLNALGPVFNAMAGLIQGNLQQQPDAAKRRNDSVNTGNRAPELVPGDREDYPHPVYRPQPQADTEPPPRSPIYIPVGGLAAADHDIEAAESQNYEARIKINALPGSGKWGGSAESVGGVVIGRPTLEKPLGDGIPISPGEVITANSDVIVGKPAVAGPRPPKITAAGHEHDHALDHGGIAVGMRPPPPHRKPWLHHHQQPPMRDEFLGPPPPPPPPGSHVGGEVQGRPPGSANHYRLHHDRPHPGLNLNHNHNQNNFNNNQKPPALKLRPHVVEGLPYKLESVVTGSQAVLVAEGGAGEVVHGSPVPHRHAVLPAGADAASLLVDIRPSQVANVLIPRGSHTAHVFSAPAPSPLVADDVFRDDSPFPVPEAAADFVGLDAAPQLEHGVGTVIEVHPGDSPTETGGVVAGLQGGDINVNIAPGQGISVDVGPGGSMVHARPDSVPGPGKEVHRIQPSGVVLDAPRPQLQPQPHRPEQPLAHPPLPHRPESPLAHPPPPPPPPPPPSSSQQSPSRRPPVTLYRPSTGTGGSTAGGRPHQYRFPVPGRPLRPSDFMTPPPPPPHLPLRPPAPKPTPGVHQHLRPQQPGGPLVIPLRPDAGRPPRPGNDHFVHGHDHEHDLHIHGDDHELHVHGLEAERDHTTRLHPVRIGGGGVVVRPGPGPVDVFVRPDGELVSVEDDLGVAGSSRPLPRPPSLSPKPSRRPPVTDLFAIWPGDRYNGSRPQHGAGPPPPRQGVGSRPGDREREQERPPQQPTLQHGFHEVRPVAEPGDVPTVPGFVNGQPKPPPDFHSQSHRQRPPPITEADNNIIVGHVPHFNELHSPVPPDDLRPHVVAVGEPTNKVDEPPGNVDHHQLHHHHVAGEVSSPEIGVVRPGERPLQSGIRFPGAGDHFEVEEDTQSVEKSDPDSTGAASGTDGSPDPPAHGSDSADSDEDRLGSILHGGTQTERPLVTLPPDNSPGHDHVHNTNTGTATREPEHRDETPSRNEIPILGVGKERPPHLHVGVSGWQIIGSQPDRPGTPQDGASNGPDVGSATPGRGPPHRVAGYRPPGWHTGGSGHLIVTVGDESGPVRDRPSGDDSDVHYGRPHVSPGGTPEDARPHWSGEAPRPPIETPVVDRETSGYGVADFGQDVPPFKAMGEDVSAVVDSVLRPPSLNLPPATAVRPTQPPPPPPPPPPRVTVLTDHRHNNKPHRQPVIVLGRPAEFTGDVATHRPTQRPSMTEEGRPGDGEPPADMTEVDKPPPPPPRPAVADLETAASTARPFKLRPQDDSVMGLAPPPPRVTVVGVGNGGGPPPLQGDSTHRPVLIGGGRKPPVQTLPPPPSEFEQPPPPLVTTPRRPPFVVTPPTPAYSSAPTTKPKPSTSTSVDDTKDELEDEDQELAETSSGSKPPAPPLPPLSPSVTSAAAPELVDVTYRPPVYTTQRPRPVTPLDATRKPPQVVSPSRTEADMLETVSVGRPVSQPLPPPPPPPPPTREAPPRPPSVALAPTPVRDAASTEVKASPPPPPAAAATPPATLDRTWTTLAVDLEGSQTRLPNRRRPTATPAVAPTSATSSDTSSNTGKVTSVVVTSGSKTVLFVKPTAARLPTQTTKSTPTPRPRPRPRPTTETGGLFDDFDDVADEDDEEESETGTAGGSRGKVDLGVASSNQEKVVVGSAPASTLYVTHTHTLTVTTTETQVVSTAGRPPVTRTVVLTKTQTSTVVDTVTETQTLLRPTSVYATVTTTVSAIRPFTEGVSSTSTVSTVTTPAPTTGSQPPPPPPPAGTGDRPGDRTAGAGDTFFVVVTDPHHKLPPPSGAPLPPGIIEYEVDKEDEQEPRQDGGGAGGNVLLTAGVGGSGAAATSACRPECSAARNEVCQRAADGHPRCLCRPGFARIFPDRPCKPTYTYTLRLVLSRHGDRPITFSPGLGDTGSDTFAETSRAAAEGLDRLVMQSDLRDVFHGVSVEAFLPPDEGSTAGVIVTFQVRLSDNTDEERLKEVFRKSLRATNYSLGGTDVFADKERIQHIEAEDFDECASRQYHDCSENAHCFNLRGTYTCSCREGFADLSENPLFPGRLCSAELIGCERCHFHGTCGDDHHQVQCECFQWYAGDTCHINLKALLIALVTIGCVLVALLLVCVLMTCARGGSRGGRTRGRSRREGPLERRAMIHDSASEASGDQTLPRSQTPAAVFGKKARPVSAPTATVVAVVPPPPAGFAPTPVPVPPPLQPPPEQRDRSLTVMIPRAKYRPSPVAPPHQPLPTLVSMSTFGDAEKRAIAHESKLLALLEGASKQDGQLQSHHHHHQHQQQTSKRKPSNTTSQATEASTPRKNSSSRKPSNGNIPPPAPGALVSAGFEVSATVGKPATDSDTEASAVVHNGSTLRTTDSVQITVEEMSEPSVKAGSAVETLTVSEARSCDETTIHPPTKSLHSNYSSKHSSNNLNNDEGHTMAERDIGSTFVMPQSHLYTPDRGSDISNFDSL
uniref:Mucin-17 n=1 Tax=Locusta migratoria TaxID=7004 RepID=A0A7D4XGP9_LOCMI|nr:mucin-17 [Locusta migratoria]